MRKYKNGDVVWVRGIVGIVVADWPQVWFNNDKHSLYIESLDDIRPARKSKRGGR